MIHAKQDSPEIGDPGLISGAEAGHVVKGAAPVGFGDEGNHSARHLAPERIVRWNDVARIRIADGNSIDQPRARRVEDLAGQNGTAEGVHAHLRAQQRAEVAPTERVDRRRVSVAGQDAGTQLEPVEVHKEERLVFSAVDFGNGYRSACRESKRVTPDLGDGRGEKAPGIQRIIGNVLIPAAMKFVGSGPGGVLDRTPGGMTQLGRVLRFGDLHLTDTLHRRSALVAVLVPRSITKGNAIEVVLRGEGLTAVDARAELAAAEHRIAIRPHGRVAGLDLQQRLRQANIRACNDWQIPVIGVAYRIPHIRLFGVHHFRRGVDFHLFGDRAKLQPEIDAVSLPADKLDARLANRFETGMLYRNGIRAQHEQRRCVQAGSVGGQRRFDAGVFVADANCCTGNAVPARVHHDPRDCRAVRPLCVEDPCRQQQGK